MSAVPTWSPSKQGVGGLVEVGLGLGVAVGVAVQVGVEV